MVRLGVFAALSLGLALSPGTPAEAQLTRQQTCDETAKIVQIASTLRANGTNKNATSRSLTEGKNEVEEPFKPMVAPLVEWVYTIDGTAIKQPGAPKTVAEQYREQCFAYQN